MFLKENKEILLGDTSYSWYLFEIEKINRFRRTRNLKLFALLALIPGMAFAQNVQNFSCSYSTKAELRDKNISQTTTLLEKQNVPLNREVGALRSGGIHIDDNTSFSYSVYSGNIPEDQFQLIQLTELDHTNGMHLTNTVNFDSSTMGPNGITSTVSRTLSRGDRKFVVVNLSISCKK